MKKKTTLNRFVNKLALGITLGELAFFSCSSFPPTKLEDKVLEPLTVVESTAPEKPRKEFVLPTEYVRDQVLELTKQASRLKGRDLYEHITREQMLKMSPYRDLVLKSAKQEGVDPYLMLAISFSENAQVDLFAGSETGCRGLFQFSKETGTRYNHTISGNIDERRDPTVTIPAAARYLAFLKSVYAGNEKMLLEQSFHGTYQVKDKDGKVIKTISPPSWYFSRIDQKRKFLSRGTIDFDESVPLFTDLRKKSVAYPVQEGDSVHSLASRFNVEERVLRELNPQVVNYKARLHEGTEVYIPKRAIKEAKYTALKLAI